jgi:hypothetical protein
MPLEGTHSRGSNSSQLGTRPAPSDRESRYRQPCGRFARAPSPVIDSNIQSVQDFAASFNPIYAVVDSVGLRVGRLKHLCMSDRLAAGLVSAIHAFLFLSVVADS